MLKIAGRIFAIFMSTAVFAGLIYWGFQSFQQTTTGSMSFNEGDTLEEGFNGFHPQDGGGGLRDGRGNGNGLGSQEEEPFGPLSVIGLGQDILIIAAVTVAVNFVKFLLRKRKMTRLTIV